MKRGKFLMLLVCLVLVIIATPVNAYTDLETIEKENIQPRFTNISVFYNEFHITDQGKAGLTSSIDARNVDECKISLYLQRYQSGSWVTVNHWSAIESGTFCGIGEIWYVMSGYQYRMVSYGYVYKDDILLESTYYVSPTQIY